MKRPAPLSRRTRPLRHGARVKRTAPKDTGFSEKVKLAIRTRAGSGDPDEACCEATGVYLGLYGGEMQHRVARLSGGRGVKAPRWFHTPANGVLLATAVHRRAEARDPHLHAQGFWLWSTQDASAEPIMLHGSDGGMSFFLTPDGGYSTERPGERGAA